jgi:hypothetical protein
MMPSAPPLTIFLGRPTFEQLKGEAQLGALEGALHAAVRDYKKEMLDSEDQEKARQKAINEQEVKKHPAFVLGNQVYLLREKFTQAK